VLTIHFLRLSPTLSFVRHYIPVSVQDAEKAKTSSNAKMHVLEDLLPIIDNFEIAAKSIKTETEAEEKINSSYQGLYRQVVDIFRGLGLEAVPTVGTQFDPEIHDGIMREENDDHDDGEVLEEFRKGFKFKDQLLRPAMVKVAVSSAPSRPQPEDVPTESD
jgi:molecular chaperone GrpE